MQGQTYQHNMRLPYSKWSQHRAANGLIYLSHPVTGEVKWLWSRHHDPKTSNDYLVNTITGDRRWVTKQNEHLCPVKQHSGDAKAAQISQPQGSQISSNPASKVPNASARTHIPATKQTSNSAEAKYRQIAAPKSLGLTADEALMLVPETGRRYIYNKKTKSSRWLPDLPADRISSESKGTGLFGRNKNSKPNSFPFDDEEIAPELREQTRMPEIPALSGENRMNSRDFSVKTASPLPSMASSKASTSSSQKSSGHQQTTTTNPGASHGYPSSNSRAPTSSSHYSNGYAGLGPAPSSNEAAVLIQRTIRGHAVRNAHVLDKLRVLITVFEDVNGMTSTGKYDMAYLRRLANGNSKKEERKDGTQRLLELAEYLIQQMLKVDAVESSGNHLVRAKRKETVKMILGMTEEVDTLTKKLQR